VDVTQSIGALSRFSGARAAAACHAGVVTRPVRERPVAEILEAVDAIVRETGFEEIALLSLSSSDYSHISDLVGAICAKYADKHLSISLPSLRIESFSVDLAEMLKDGGRPFHFCAGSRHGSNAPPHQQVHPDQQLLTRARSFTGLADDQALFHDRSSRRNVDDVQAIADLTKAVLKQAPGSRQSSTSQCRLFDVRAQAAHAVPVGDARQGRIHPCQTVAPPARTRGPGLLN
jgi:hypothetical protein